MGRPSAAALSESQAWLREGLDLDRRASSGDWEALHLLGVFCLISGELDAAVEKLTAAYSLNPEEALGVDLTAALLERSGQGRYPLDLIRAAALGLARAKTDRPSAALAANTALALTKLGLRRSSAKLLNSVLDTETESGWQEELKNRRDALHRPSAEQRWPVFKARLVAALHDPAELQEVVAMAVLSDPLRARLLAEEALQKWAQDPEPDAMRNWLSLARALGRELADTTGDEMLVESVEAIDTGANANLALQEMRGGFHDFADASALLAKNDSGSAAKLFEASERQLAAASNPFALRAEFFAAFCAYHQDTQQGMAQLLLLKSKLDATRYPYLAGRVEWVLGSGKKTLGQLQEALDHYRRAEVMLSRAAGPAESSFIGILVAETLQLAGDTEAAWKARIAAMGQVPLVAQPERETAMLFEASNALGSVGAEEVALAALSELQMAAEATGKPYWRATAELYSGLNQIELGQIAAGLDSLDRAQLRAQEIPLGPQRQGLEARMSLFRGIALSEKEPARSLELLQAGLAQEMSLGQKFFRLPALRAQVQAQLALQRYDDALADLLAIVDDFERTRSELADWKTQRAASHLAQAAAETVLDRRELATVLSEDQRFQLADKLRGWALTKGSDTRASLPLVEIQRSLSPSMAMVHLTVLPSQLLIWVIRRDASFEVHLPSGRQELTRKIEILESAFQANSTDRLDESLESLYTSVFVPLKPSLEGVDTLVIVPDETVSALPFSALRDAGRKRYLIEDFQLSLAPSASLWLEHQTRERTPASRSPLVVGVGRPGNGLKDLDRVPAEVGRIAALFPGSARLVEAEAAPEKVLAELRDRSIVHFASHALVDSANPGASKLVLSGQDLDSASLTIERAVSGGLAEADLVVLAACSALEHELNDRDVVLGAAGYLYAAGAPAVLAARRRLGDKFAAQMMPRFLANYKQGESAASAWQKTIREFLGSGRLSMKSPLVWGHLAVVGGLPAASSP